MFPNHGLSLISDPLFIEAHLKKSSNNDDFAHHHLIFARARLPGVVLKQFSLRPAFNHRPEPVSLIEATEFEFLISGSSFEIAGSCNGLVCIVMGEREYFLWNLSTRKVKKLPD